MNLGDKILEWFFENLAVWFLIVVAAFGVHALTATNTNTPLPVPAVPAAEYRFKITENQTFNDARGYIRNILVLKDAMTGKEFIFVTGSGGVEIPVPVKTGKTTHTEEQ